MMMEISSTSLLVILGIFCSSALAQPSPEEQEAMRCMEPAVRQCIMPLAMPYRGMSLEQIVNQIRTTDLAQTCGPVLTASQCLTNKVSECGLGQLDNPMFVDAVKQMRVANIIANYVCRDHVEVFNEHKACLLNDLNGDTGDALEQCPRLPRPGRNRRFCVPQGLVECVANLAQQDCGEEIGNEFRSLGQQVLAEAGCSARKLFKLMKKEMDSPLELMHKAFPSFF